MTYFGFLGLFVFIPILFLFAIFLWDEKRGKSIPGFQKNLVGRVILVHIGLALFYTTPWDNYLVATKVWSYNPKLVTGFVIGYVPIEEYTFFVAETILAGLWWLFLARRITFFAPEKVRSNWLPVSLPTFLLSTSWLFFTYKFFFGPDSWNYLGIIFFWALPAIFPQFLFGADILWIQRKLIFWAVVPPAIYLSLADIVALKATTWSISLSQTLGIKFFGILPLEEVAFFFITNALIGFGLTLMLSELGHQRLANWRSRNNWMST